MHGVARGVTDGAAWPMTWRGVRGLAHDVAWCVWRDEHGMFMAWLVTWRGPWFDVAHGVAWYAWRDMHGVAHGAA